MNIALLGGTGATGSHLIDQALERGHHVRALARDPQALGGRPAGLEVVRGDALDGGAVREAVSGAEAVLSVLGHRRDSPPDLLRRATGHVVAAMRATGARRLVVLTGAGVRDPSDRPKPVDRAFGVALRLVSRKLLEDSVKMAEAIRAGDLEWVIVRAPRLTEGPRGVDAYVGPVGPASGTRAARATVAAFMLDQLETDAHLRTSPVVTER